MDALQHPWLKKMVNVEKVKTEVAKRTLNNLKNFRVSKFKFRPVFSIITTVNRVFSYYR
jgi:hypothetical protein